MRQHIAMSWIATVAAAATLILIGCAQSPVRAEVGSGKRAQKFRPAD